MKEIFKHIVSSNPTTWSTSDCITLRDYFAANALVAMMGNDCYSHGYTGIAASAYSYADAMMAERNKNE